MHRTQITLEDSQYVTLRERARRTGKSMGQLIREMLNQELEAKPKVRKGHASGLAKLAGVLNDRAAAYVAGTG